jgi:cytochrome P450
MPQGFLNTAIQSIGDLATSYIFTPTKDFITKSFFTPEGLKFMEQRTNYVTDQVTAAQQEEKSHFVQPITRFVTSYVSGIRPSFFKLKSITTITSGTEDPAARTAFTTFKSMFDLSNGTPVSWVLNQDKQAQRDRHILARQMQGERLALIGEYTAEHIRRKWAEVDIQHLPDNHCWYQWFHRLVIEIVAHKILGISIVPAHTGPLLDEVEEAIINDTPPLRVCNKDISLTASQKKFTRLKAEFRELADELINANKDEILAGEGYLKDILKDAAERTDKSIAALFEDDYTQLWLGVAAGGLLLAAGTLSATMAIGFTHLGPELNQRVDNLDSDIAGFINHFFKEALRYTSGGGLSARYLSKAQTLLKKDGSTVTIPANTAIFMDFRNTNYDSSLWKNPETFSPDRHEDKAAPHLDSVDFSPFSLGPRMCPGRKFSEVVFEKTMSYLLQQNLQVSCDPSLKNLKSADDSSPWTTRNFITRLRPGLKLTAEVTTLTPEKTLRMGC